MKVEKPKLLSEDKRGTNWDTGDYSLIIRKAGTWGGDHSHDTHETLIFLRGDIEVEASGEKKKLKSPVKIVFSPGEHHTVWFKTDTIFIEKRCL